MKRSYWLASVVVLATGFGCGDDTASGGGGSNGGTDQGGDPSNGGGGNPTTGGAPAGGGGSGGVADGGGGGVADGGGGASAGGGGAGEGGGLALYEDCTEDGDCASGICHEFNGQNVTICTQECSDNNPCPAPSAGCNGMGICRPPA